MKQLATRQGDVPRDAAVMRHEEAGNGTPSSATATSDTVAAQAQGPRLSEAVLAELHWLASEGSPSLSRHARIVLARNEGRSLSEISKIMDVDRATARRWLLRFER